MGQVIDLGIGIFENPRQEQCLLSRTTATLVFQGDAAYHANEITNATDLKGIWVILKRELTVTLRLETNWRFMSSLPAVVKQLADAVERVLIASSFKYPSYYAKALIDPKIAYEGNCHAQYEHLQSLGHVLDENVAAGLSSKFPDEGKFSNDTMLMEERDLWTESDEDILSSYENSMSLSVGSYVPLSQRPLRSFVKEEVNGYESKNDSAIFQWGDSDYECDFNLQPHDERRESMFLSSSLNLGTTSDITMENTISCGTAPLCESVAHSKYPKAYSESSIMDDSTSLPILSASPSTISSAFHDIPLTPILTADDENIDIIISDLGHHLDEDTARVASFLVT
ncbi:hypothetical protein PISL3812_02500 [Talaromyces islandicus]|uniref:Uncharacterized protein n=1 Tax=Talaromyces islandicus TaxID=28573 RepID=A0A0U1LSE0_TALIS|nr:hypothetical protein PISL3812_02500 [Talaromyces islandicus]